MSKSKKSRSYSEPRRELYVSRESARFERTAERKQARQAKVLAQVSR